MTFLWVEDDIIGLSGLAALLTNFWLEDDMPQLKGLVVRSNSISLVENVPTSEADGNNEFSVK